MTQSPLWPSRWFAALAVLLIALGGSEAVAKTITAEAATATPTSTESLPSAPASTTRATVPPAPDAEPIPDGSGGDTPASPKAAPLIEGMGPETFPNRLTGSGGIIATVFGGRGIEQPFQSSSRGLYGGSLWLEPTFHGLQWPQNTRTGIAISGNLWFDSGYQKIIRDRPKEQQADLELTNSDMIFQQGHAVVRVTPAYVNGSFFVQGQVELAGSLCKAASGGYATNPQPNTVCQSAGTFSADDLWIRVGQWNLWDLKVGSFEAWEIYHVGMGLERYSFERMGAGMFGAPQTADPNVQDPVLYTLDFLRDRPSDGLASGYIAGHAYLTQYLRFELLGKLGDDSYRSDGKAVAGENASTYWGGRPAMIFDIGWLKLKVGAEYQKRRVITQLIDSETGLKKDSPEERTQKGVGGSLQLVFDPVIELGVSAAIGKQQHTNQFANRAEYSANAFADSWINKSIGAFANVSFAGLWRHLPMLGLGVNRTTQEDEYRATDSKANDYVHQLQGFAALQYLLAGQLYIKAVFAYAQAKYQPSSPTERLWTNTLYSGRIKLMYLY